MSKPFLIGKRVILRAIEEEDAERYAEWINHPDIRDYLLVRLPMSVKSEKDWIANLSVRKGPPSFLALAIERRRDGKHIGSVGLHEISWIQRRATTGSFICPASLRGKGYGTEAKGLLLDYVFGELGLHSLWAAAFAGNEASCRALEKQGYKKSGVFRKAYLVKGKWVDAIYYDILREDWEKMRRPAPPEKTTKRVAKN